MMFLPNTMLVWPIPQSAKMMHCSHFHTPILCSKILLYILASTAGNDASEKNIVLFFSQCLV